MDRIDDQELISALADGQLRGDAFARAVQLAATGEGRRTWDRYHLVGEVLRSGRAPVAGGSEAFIERLQMRLQQEQPARAPQPAVPVAVAAASAQPAANDWRWKLLAGLASVAAVAAVGWNMLDTLPAAAGQPQLAAAPAPAAASEPPHAAAMIRDPRLDQLLAAHRHLGGAGALQGPSGFLRNATFEGPAR